MALEHHTAFVPDLLLLRSKSILPCENGNAYPEDHLQNDARGLANLPPDQLIFPELLRWKHRLTTFPLEGLRLPIPFVRLVLEALKEKKISPRKAAALLMVTVDDLVETYGIELNEEEELAS